VAAKPRAHVELRTGRWRGLLGLVAAGRVEAEPQHADRTGNAKLPQTQLLACGQRLPPRLEIEQRGAARILARTRAVRLIAVEVEFLRAIGRTAPAGPATAARVPAAHCPAPRRTTISRAASPASILPRSRVIAKMLAPSAPSR